MLCSSTDDGDDVDRGLVTHVAVDEEPEVGQVDVPAAREVEVWEPPAVQSQTGGGMDLLEVGQEEEEEVEVEEEEREGQGVEEEVWRCIHGVCHFWN